ISAHKCLLPTLPCVGFFACHLADTSRSSIAISSDRRSTVAHHAEHFALVLVIICMNPGYGRAPPEAARICGNVLISPAPSFAWSSWSRRSASRGSAVGLSQGARLNFSAAASLQSSSPKSLSTRPPEQRSRSTEEVLPDKAPRHGSATW